MDKPEDLLEQLCSAASYYYFLPFFLFFLVAAKFQFLFHSNQKNLEEQQQSPPGGDDSETFLQLFTVLLFFRLKSFLFRNTIEGKIKWNYLSASNY